jgi:His-Xaa-Ser system radical SAM maturase HxsB
MMRQPFSILNNRFRPPDTYADSSETYTLLPFRFLSLDGQRYILSNFVGEHYVLPKETLRQFIRHQLPHRSDEYEDLKSRHFLADAESTVALDLLAIKYRTKQAILSRFTSLFIFVTTLRCDHSCPYCQVSRQSQDRVAFDMTPTTAERAIAFMFKSPSPAIKVEFQGGESLLNFDIIKFIVESVEKENQQQKRNVAFVIATNLSTLTDEHLRYCLKHDIYISTSLDGPRELHNRNRPRPGLDSYEKTIEAIARVRKTLGSHKIAALMTTTEASLSQPTEIIDEYLRQGFNSIFLRSISPYGFAIKTGLMDGYHTSEWLEFYKHGLEYIVDLNSRGVPFREEYATMILRKILTPYGTTYVDLQSPAGIGISCLVFNYDGDIYASDESRMLAEMGDKTFRLGNLQTNTFEEVLGSDVLLRALQETMTESMPMCADCGVQPYCGSDPVHHHTTQGDWVGFKPTSDFCKKNMGVIRHLIGLLEDDPRAASVLRSWA